MNAIARVSIGGLTLTSLPRSVSANETNQISQGGRREQRDDGLVDTTLVVRVEHRQVGPTPWQGPHHTVVESYQHPRYVVAPKHTAHAASLAARPALLRHDRESRTTECNIRCSVSLA